MLNHVYKLPFFLLDKAWYEKSNGRIVYCICGFQNIEAHNTYVEEEVEKIIKESEDHFVRNEETSRVTKKQGIMFATVVCFRRRDSF